VAEGKELRDFDGETYVMEKSLVPEISLIKADIADMSGNLRFNMTARNFNPMMATAARVTVAQVEHLVRPGEIDADHIHTPGIFVKRMITCPTGYEKRIEQRTVRKHAPAAAAGAESQG
jgi:3-oxoacid CoA-transferase subunit A